MTNRSPTHDDGQRPRGLGPLVVLDTSVWVRERLLTSTKATVLLDIVTRSGGLIGLPVVVKRELLAVVPRLVQAGLDKARNELGFAEVLLGRSLLDGTPSAADCCSAVHRRLESELADLVEEMPHTLALVDAALERVIDRLPPNAEKNEQFRDSLILEIALEAGLHRDVLLVTGDLAFFHERDPDKGPAPGVSQTIESLKSRLRIYGDVVACAAALSPAAPEYGREKAVSLIAENIRSEVQAVAGAKLFAAATQLGARLDAVPTTQPGSVFISFVLTYELESLPKAAGQERSSAELQAQGNCYYDYQRATVTSWNLDEIRLAWHDVDGTPRHATVKYFSAGLSARAVFMPG